MADTLEAPPAGPDNRPTAGSEDRDRDDIRMVRDLFYRARDARRPLIRQWKQWYKTLNNRTWSSGAAGGWEPTSEIPQMWPVLASLVAWMTDQRPILSTMAGGQPFSPHNDFYDKLAKDMNAVLESQYVNHSEDAEITRMLWDVCTYGIGWTKTIWDATLADGLGDETFRRLDPFTCYPDPFARSPKDMDHFIEAKIMTLSQVDRAWPGAAAKLGYNSFMEELDESPHILDDSISQTSPRAVMAPPTSGGSTQYQFTRRAGASDVQNRDEPVVSVLECWIKSHEVAKTDDPNVVRVNDVWTCYIVCGNTLLFKGTADEVSGHNLHPYDRCVLFDTGEMYGPSLVDFMTSPQQSINRIISMIERNAILHGNPILAESPRSQSKHQRKSNRPGMVISARPDEVGWVQPPQLHPQMSVALIQYFESKIESISGMTAIVRGFMGNGRNAQGVMDSVQDAAFVRIRATLRELERTLRGITWKKCATIAEFYTEPRFMSIIGQDGQNTRTALAQRHFYTAPDETGERVPLRFSILADAGSQLPTSKQARSAEADTLFALGAIDVLELLKAKQWPNYSIVAKRVMEAQAAQGMAGGVTAPGKRERARA
jgi:hypothetical protein